MPPLPEPPENLLDRLAALEGRVVALEAVLGDTQAAAVEKKDVMAKLEWAMKHGRQRPW